MITVSFEDVLKDPVNVLSSILSFVWREDREYEGHGGKDYPREAPGRSWEEDAADLTKGASYRTMLEIASSIFESSPLLIAAGGDGNDSIHREIQDAFASEMRRSSDMTSWPCPSFWEGLDTGENGGNQMKVLQQLASNMIPNCSDDDPFARCTVNRDRCEVRREAKCK